MGEPQYAWVADYTVSPAVDREVELPPRGGGFPHLSECLLFIDPEMHCSCDDDSPEWTI